jgi:hypothetical protein
LTGPDDDSMTVLMATVGDNWTAYSKTFDLVMATIGFPETATNVIGHLSSGDLERNALESEHNDIWTFSGQGGRYATINLIPAESGIDLTLSLIDPAGNILITTDGGYAGDPEVMTDILLPDSGTYIIEVGEFFSENGRYTLSLDLTDDPQFGGGGRIDFGREVTTELAENSEQIWVFNGTADQDVTIIVSSLDDQLDVILELRGPDGRELVTKDESFAGDAEVLTGFELSVTGEYAIIVQGFAGRGGAYSLSLDEGGESTVNFYDAGDLAFGDNKREFLREDEAHAWFFDGRAGDEVTINVTPITANMDMDVWLLDPELDELAMKDEYSSGEAEKIEFTLPVDGQYLVLVREFFGDPGEYQVVLDVSEEEPLTVAGSIRYGQAITATLLPGKSVGWTFDGIEGDIINIDLASVGPERDLVLELVDPAGETVVNLDSALSGLAEELIDYELPLNGQWMIVVREFFNDGSRYRLALTGTS